VTPFVDETCPHLARGLALQTLLRSRGGRLLRADNPRRALTEELGGSGAGRFESRLGHRFRPRQRGLRPEQEPGAEEKRARGLPGQKKPLHGAELCNPSANRGRAHGCPAARS
jgi:hypothetical protein